MLLTVAEVAERLHCSDKTIYRAVRERLIESFRPPGGIRIREEEVERILAESRRPNLAEIKKQGIEILKLRA